MAKVMTRPINAKSELAGLKPMFRHAFKNSRILVTADTFYEWKLTLAGKQPYLIRLTDHSLMGFAGLLEH